MASVLSVPDNQSEDKHVESSLVPRLDEGSNPSSSTCQTLKIALIISAIFILRNRNIQKSPNIHPRTVSVYLTF